MTSTKRKLSREKLKLWNWLVIQVLQNSIMWLTSQKPLIWS